MIPVKCVTNLDGLEGEKWPSYLPVIPNIGHRIQSATCHYKNNYRYPFQLELKVVGVRWYIHDQNTNEWRVEIELHDMFDRSIYEFQDWYSRCTGKA